MSKLAKQFVIEWNGPILTKELYNIWNESRVIPLDNLVQVLNIQTNERVKWGDNDLLTAKVGDSLNHAIWIDQELYVMTFKVFDVLWDQLTAYQGLLVYHLRQRSVCPFDVVIDHPTRECTANADRHVKLGQFVLTVSLRGQVSQVHQLQDVLGKDRSQFSTIVPVQSQALSYAEVLVPLAELADFSTCKNLLLRSLEVGLDNQPSVVDQSVLVDDVEDLAIDVDEAGCDKKGGRRVEFLPLLLLQELNLPLWRYFLLHILWILLIKVLAHLIANLLQLDLNFLPLPLNHLLQLFKIIRLLPKPNTSQRIPINLKELKPQLHLNPNMSQMINNNLLNIKILKSIRIIY